jgi:hypothetical protein
MLYIFLNKGFFNSMVIDCKISTRLKEFFRIFEVASCYHAKDFFWFYVSVKCRLIQLFTKYKYIWYLATMFRPFTGSLSGLYNKLESVLHFLGFVYQTGSRVVYSVVHSFKSSDEKMED